MSSSEPTTKNNVIRRNEVRLVEQAAMLDCGTLTDGRASKPLAIIPVMDGDRVAGFEVRCGCGASAIVECVYEDGSQPLSSQNTAPQPQTDRTGPAQPEPPPIGDPS